MRIDDVVQGAAEDLGSNIAHDVDPDTMFRSLQRTRSRRRITSSAVAACVAVFLSFGAWTVARDVLNPQSAPVPPAEMPQPQLSQADVSFLSDAGQLKPMPSRLPDALVVRIGHAYCDHLSQGGSIAPIINVNLTVPLNADIGLDTAVSVPLGWDANEAVLAAAIHNYCPSYRAAFDTAWRTPSRFLYFRPGTPQTAKELQLIQRLVNYVNIRSN
jgi:hypothetical protein